MKRLPWPNLPAQDAATPTGQPYTTRDGLWLSLHFTAAELQSRMNLADPWSLEVDYTRTMMGFLLFKPQPKRITLVGLGGGSLAKFCWRNFSSCCITVLEINPQVLALRREFCVPDNDARFQVLLADGAEYLAAAPLHEAKCEVLLVDGFDAGGQPEALCSQKFYDDCFAALEPGGVLVVNLHHDAPDYPVRAERVRRSFAGNAFELPALEKSNCIVFASKGPAFSPRKVNLKTSLAGLNEDAKAQLKTEFGRIAFGMRDLGDA